MTSVAQKVVNGLPHVVELIPHMGQLSELLCLLLAITLVVPLMMRLKTSPIIGFLLIGLVLGPSGLGVMNNTNLAHRMADLGIVFFLFETGLELTIKKVLSMRADVFGLGTCQYLGSGLLIAGLASVINPSLPSSALVVLGGSLALSSSAFGLQLLRDNSQMGTRFGRASFGVLLFQDLAVVPLLVMLPLLGGGEGGSFVQAGMKAVVKATVALGFICVLGQVFLRKVFYWVKRSGSSEAFLAATLGTVLLCSQITEGLGLSDTLGAFVGGVLVAETNYSHQVEADIAPFRGMLLGLFFVTVGFALDLKLLATQWTTVLPLLLGLLVLKAVVVICGCLAWGLSGASALQSAMLLAPGGEFAFVVFGVADRLQLIPTSVSSVLVTTTVLSMAMTPVLVAGGAKLAAILRQNRGQQNLEGSDQRAATDIGKIETSREGFVIVCGWNAVSRAICDLLDAEGRAQYIVFEDNPKIVADARASGLPVYLVDCTSREVLDKFKVGSSRLVVLCSPRQTADRQARVIRRIYPDIPILVRAEDVQHKRFLRSQLKVKAVIPGNISVRFGGTVLKELGYPQEEVDGLLQQQIRSINAQQEDL